MIIWEFLRDSGSDFEDRKQNQNKRYGRKTAKS